VRNAISDDLQLRSLKKIVGIAHTEKHEQLRVACARRFLREMTWEKVNKTFFTDEKIFKLQSPKNMQNDRVYHPRSEKKDTIEPERIYIKRSGFPKWIMISAGVSTMGKTSLFFIERGVKINSEVYQELLDQMLPECHDIAGGDFIFQQDGARAHTSASTMEYLEQHGNFDYIPPHKWPAHSPDLNPMDYSLWNELETALHRRNTFETLADLKSQLITTWNRLPQEHINNAINAFRRRCQLVIDAEGGNIEHFR
jgi:inhibitor of nuclear factor kappa-B kinase subunit alpha